jgi:hypothetical protein
MTLQDFVMIYSDYLIDFVLHIDYKYQHYYLSTNLLFTYFIFQLHNLTLSLFLFLHAYQYFDALKVI